MNENNAGEEWTRQFAQNNGVTIRYETPLPSGVPAYKYEDNGSHVVVLDSSLPPERQNFALAHEVAHIQLGHTDEVETAEEFEANRLASELLLPGELFRPESWRSLRELKELFIHASFEAIARRKLMFHEGVLTIFDNEQFVRRINTDNFSAPQRPTNAELKLISRSYIEQNDLVESFEDLSFEATYVDDGRGVARVLLMVMED